MVSKNYIMKNRLFKETTIIMLKNQQRSNQAPEIDTFTIIPFKYPQLL